MSTSAQRQPDAALRAAEARLREVMLGLPETTEEFPWGHRTAKVKGKMFAILVLDAEGLRVTTKLPTTHEAALMLPFAEPTGYGLGKSGWVTASFARGQVVPVDLLSMWVHESFRAVAPKAVLAAWEAGGSPGVKKSTRKRAAVKKKVAAGVRGAKTARAAPRTKVKRSR
ncbi:MmcQ/YjbR family DNA-binding protein [Myxococcus sp. K15C18031901]|uniref:MmcQ/YjbR family DNA-binding protein n=1 Tax=Myxococcus dinghuensis TaxID=2906761 RepID=UPI0020A7315C|nr:MmcQ/YjbR family DNA-binding protein [Myxococcus dinghuensis]MCP3100703.1 MmcQ/YjbR family DNA-binding protein [Myxococcus dinghuensis]